MKPFLVALLAAASLTLSACQSAPQLAPQKGNDTGQQSAGVTPTAPVDQTGTNGRSVIIAPTIVMPTGAAADAKTPTMAITVTIGSKADGDLKTSGKTETGAQTATQTTSQESSPSQDISPEALGKAAADVLSVAAPGGEAATLAGAAIEALKGGDGTTAAAKLAAAKAALKIERAAAKKAAEPAPAPPPAPGG